MVRIGNRPILWHIMRYYAHYGHTDFVLCLGHQADVIKEYFLNYNEALSNDFCSRAGGGADRSAAQRHRATGGSRSSTPGSQSNVGERLAARAPSIVEDEEMFLANYGDTLTDAPLPTADRRAPAHRKVANFLCVRPRATRSTRFAATTTDA